jgi:hypothetical protein
VLKVRCRTGQTEQLKSQNPFKVDCISLCYSEVHFLADKEALVSLLASQFAYGEWTSIFLDVW